MLSVLAGVNTSLIELHPHSISLAVEEMALSSYSIISIMMGDLKKIKW